MLQRPAGVYLGSDGVGIAGKGHETHAGNLI